jgi:malate dehydrogenase (oxaloacetate-decarboxylating)
VDAIISTVKAISPGFGGINLEDISAPRCFEIETRLRDELNIPVFHDDQHGTAIAVLAALKNALLLVGKKLEAVKIVLSGVGAAGIACAKILLRCGASHVIPCDTHGAIYPGRSYMNPVKEELAGMTNPNKVSGSLKDVLTAADVFIGVSAGNILQPADLGVMNSKAIVFALSNPIPEVDPEGATAYASVVATGRSDFPNQINNVLVFPGIFRGALDAKAEEITEKMELAAADAIAQTITPDELSSECIIPTAFHSSVARRVAEAVKRAAEN